MFRQPSVFYSQIQNFQKSTQTAIRPMSIHPLTKKYKNFKVVPRGPLIFEPPNAKFEVLLKLTFVFFDYKQSKYSLSNSFFNELLVI